jgi:deoxyadenosine/deoxycytidine kinase
MGKLIAVFGNSGVGKSTFTKHLCKAGSFTPILEEMEGRPFTWKFHADRKRFVVQNQVDYYLYQAEQEYFIRTNDVIGVQDSGLDSAFNVFTKRFYQKGYLDKDEYLLCQRLYTMLRRFLPPPDLIIELYAPLPTITDRMVKRGRDHDIERKEDLQALDKLIKDWFVTITTIPIIRIDSSLEDSSYSSAVESLIKQIPEKLGMQ